MPHQHQRLEDLAELFAWKIQPAVLASEDVGSLQPYDYVTVGLSVFTFFFVFGEA